jgi:hypothetical protein
MSGSVSDVRQVLDGLSPSMTSSIKKEALKEEFDAAQSKLKKVNALVEDMMFDELDAALADGLGVVVLAYKALNGKSDAARNAATELLASAKKAAGSAETLLSAGARESRPLMCVFTPLRDTAGRKISEDPDDEASTTTFVDVSEVFPGLISSLLNSVATILSGSLLNEGDAPMLTACIR